MTPINPDPADVIDAIYRGVRDALTVDAPTITDAIKRAVHDAFTDANIELVEAGYYGDFGFVGAVKVAVLASLPEPREILDALAGAVYEATRDGSYKTLTGKR